MRVIVLTGKFGMGHYAVADTLTEAIKDRFVDIEATTVDFFDYMMPNHAEAMYKSFNLLVKSGAGLYSKLQKIAEKAPADSPNLMVIYFADKMCELVDEFKPDVIISTFPVCSQVVSEYKEKYNKSIPLLTCITDISSKNEWISKNTDSYLVPCRSIKDELVAKGIDANKIQVFGIPVKKEFRNLNAITLNVKSGRKSRRGKRVLLMGGGLGLLPKSDGFYRKLSEIKGVSFTVITGSNKKLYMKLKDKYENIEVLSYTNKVHRYMKEADLIITKPGGITLFETIYAHLPILAFEPCLPNEMKNVDFIKDNEIGDVLTKNNDRNIEIIKSIVNDGLKLKKYGNNMKKLVKTFDNEAVLNILGKYDRTMGGATKCM